jgi:hypothetical protein
MTRDSHAAANLEFLRVLPADSLAPCVRSSRAIVCRERYGRCREWPWSGSFLAPERPPACGMRQTLRLPFFSTGDREGRVQSSVPAIQRNPFGRFSHTGPKLRFRVAPGSRSPVLKSDHLDGLVECARAAAEFRPVFLWSTSLWMGWGPPESCRRDHDPTPHAREFLGGFQKTLRHGKVGEAG